MKVLTWARTHQYQWESKELKRANAVACFVLIGLLLSLGCMLGISVAVELGETLKTITVGCFGVLYGTALGFCFALEWADKKLKKGN